MSIRPYELNHYFYRLLTIIQQKSHVNLYLGTDTSVESGIVSDCCGITSFKMPTVGSKLKNIFINPSPKFDTLFKETLLLLYFSWVKNCGLFQPKPTEENIYTESEEAVTIQ